MKKKQNQTVFDENKMRSFLKVAYDRKFQLRAIWRVFGI